MREAQQTAMKKALFHGKFPLPGFLKVTGGGFA
jgi:hypothetical protein